MIEPFKPLSPGDIIDADWLNQNVGGALRTVRGAGAARANNPGDGTVSVFVPFPQANYTRVAKITAVGTSDGFYDGVEQIWDGSMGGWIDKPGGLTWDDEVGNKAELFDVHRMVGLYQGLSPDIQFYVFPQLMIDDEGNEFWFFTGPRRLGEVFRVKLTNDGGSAGNKTTQCSFTYTVKDEDDQTLAALATPEQQRPAKGVMVSGDGKNGLAYYSWQISSVQLVLHSANETIGVEACP